MTKKERAQPRSAGRPAAKSRDRGRRSGLEVSELNKLLKMHRQMADMMKKMGGMGKKGLMRGGLGALFGKGGAGMPPGMTGGPPGGPLGAPGGTLPPDLALPPGLSGLGRKK